MVGVLVSIAGAILPTVVSLATNEAVRVWGFTDKLEALKSTLVLIDALLDDADKQKTTSRAVMEWLKQLKNAVGEADDVLDEIQYEILRRDVKKRNRKESKVPSLPSLGVRKIKFRIEMGYKIDGVSKKLNDIKQDASVLQLVQQPNPVPSNLFRETDPLPDGFKVVRREKEELHIIQLLTESRKEEKLTIVPIVGMGGIGKTTLAKSIYNNPTIQQHFEVKVWLCVSVKTEVDKLLAKIYESVDKEGCKSQLRTNIIADLQNKLGSKRYLLVLDDVWEEESAYWDDFKECMLKVNLQTGSGILVTTRSLEIGRKTMSENSHVLQSLSDDECWCIFIERAFVVGRSPLPDLEEKKLMKTGHEIVEMCRGLPLSVNVIGGMLRNCNDIKKWLSTKDEVWRIEEGVRVQNILKLSFDNLPNSIVKQCFVYCSTFKKDEVMNREELIRLWMALGLVQADETRKKQAEDVGNDIFQILVSRSLFQDVKMDEYGYVTCCMHDLVHDLSLSLSEHESLCLVDPKRDDIEDISQVKHLSLLNTNQEYKISINSLMTARTLHTLILKGFQVEKNLSFQSFKCMKILKLRGCGLMKIDNSIGELVHLKYLDLSYNNHIKVLPKSICKLYLLQTLKLLSYSDLPKLPQDMSNLTSLQHLIYRGAISILNVGRLTSLRTLPLFRVGGEKGYQIEELGGLKHLAGELSITHLENISSKEDATKADLSRKKKLSHILFQWNSGWHQKADDVLEGLQPPSDLRSLTIRDFPGDNFPAWVAKMAIDIEGKWTPLHKLVNIELRGCCDCPYLPVLEYLPLLRDLVLRDMPNLECLSTSSGEGVNATSSIKPLSPSLRSLTLEWMSSLVQWNIDATTNSSTMLSPVLQSLYIGFCPQIIHLNESRLHPLVSLEIRECENLVSIQSIQGLTSLESLKIWNCPSLVEVPCLQDYERHPLKTLNIINCTKLTSLPCNIFDCFSFLIVLELGGFSEELHSFPSLQGIEKLRDHLRSLYLKGWSHWKSIPEQVQHLTSLTRLKIWGFGMEELPMWLTNMSSIRVLEFHNCKGLDEKTIKQGAPKEAEEVNCY